MGNIKGKEGCSALSGTFIAVGETVLDAAQTTVDIDGLQSGDLVFVTLSSDDSGTAITEPLLAEEMAASGYIRITRTDDASSADDAIANYFVVRPA